MWPRCSDLYQVGAEFCLLSLLGIYKIIGTIQEARRKTVKLPWKVSIEICTGTKLWHFLWKLSNLVHRKALRIKRQDIYMLIYLPIY